MKVRLIDGEFPAYANLFRKTHESTVRASRAQLTDALRKVRLSSGPPNDPAAVTVDKGNIHLSVTDIKQGSAHDDVELTNGSKSVSTVRMNPEYALKLLKAVDSDNVQIG